MTCMDEKDLEVYASGKGGLKRIRWRKHLNACSDCREKLEDLERNLALAAELKAALKDEGGEP